MSAVKAWKCASPALSNAPKSRCPGQFLSPCPSPFEPTSCPSQPANDGSRLTSLFVCDAEQALLTLQVEAERDGVRAELSMLQTQLNGSATERERDQLRLLEQHRLLEQQQVQISRYQRDTQQLQEQLKARLRELVGECNCVVSESAGA